VAEGEGRDEREDLFEDLDKFFAPIQDVDWPETSEGEAAAEATAKTEPEGEVAQGEIAEVVEEVAEVEEVEEVEPEAEPPEEAPAREELFGARETETEWVEEEEPEGATEGVEAFLFADEGGEEVEVGEAIISERAERAPDAYVGLPGPAEEEGEAAVAEPIEEAPTPEDLEAAAEHFAESVRDEVSVELEAEGVAVEAGPETGIEELLGAAEEETPGEGEEAPAVRTVRVGTEGLGGPSWQEPTAVEVGPETERRAPGRNVQLAFLTGIVLAALAVGAIWIGPDPFAALVGIVVLVAQGEFYFALQKRHYQPATALGLVTGALVLGAAYFRGEGAMLAVTALGVIATFLWYMTVPAEHRRNVVSNVGLTVLGIAWIPMFAGYILPVLELEDGRALVLSILGLTVAYDASAFAVGYFWGSRPLAPTVSPKKSWEGAIGATLVVIAVAVGIVAPSVGLLDTIPKAVGLAVVVAFFAPLGDLSESLVKRDLGIKDMGSVLPGHGGILDRIDGMLFVVPAAFLYLRLLLV
jgi:phosphatidate cytidylyltransferase